MCTRPKGLFHNPNMFLLHAKITTLSLLKFVLKFSGAIYKQKYWHTNRWGGWKDDATDAWWEWWHTHTNACVRVKYIYIYIYTYIDTFHKSCIYKLFVGNIISPGNEIILPILTAYTPRPNIEIIFLGCNALIPTCIPYDVAEMLKNTSDICIYIYIYINSCTPFPPLDYAWIYTKHDDVIKWKLFPRYWPFVQGIHRSPVNSPHKGQWRGALIFTLICVWINGWVNNREAGDLSSYRAHYDVTVMRQLEALLHFSCLRSPVLRSSPSHVRTYCPRLGGTISKIPHQNEWKALAFCAHFCVSTH